MGNIIILSKHKFRVSKSIIPKCPKQEAEQTVALVRARRAQNVIVNHLERERERERERELLQKWDNNSRRGKARVATPLAFQLWQTNVTYVRTDRKPRKPALLLFSLPSPACTSLFQHTRALMIYYTCVSKSKTAKAKSQKPKGSGERISHFANSLVIAARVFLVFLIVCSLHYYKAGFER